MEIKTNKLAAINIPVKFDFNIIKIITFQLIINIHQGGITFLPLSSG